MVALQTSETLGSHLFLSFVFPSACVVTHRDTHERHICSVIAVQLQRKFYSRPIFLYIAYIELCRLAVRIIALPGNRVRKKEKKAKHNDFRLVGRQYDSPVGLTLQLFRYTAGCIYRMLYTNTDWPFIYPLARLFFVSQGFRI